jgi:hypothetical protein
VLTAKLMMFASVVPVMDCAIVVTTASWLLAEAVNVARSMPTRV